MGLEVRRRVLSEKNSHPEAFRAGIDDQGARNYG